MRLAVLGHPVAHSRSPAMHTAALAELGLADEWTYEAIDIAPEGFEALTRSLPAVAYAGVNVTVPHKLAALALADVASEAAAAIGAANMLSFGDGQIAADNTDAAGIVASMPEPPVGKRALVLGAGGSARAVVWALREAGADVAVWNRTGERAERLASELAVDHAPTPQPGFDLLVNATTVGLAGANSARPGGRHPDARGLPDLKALNLNADWLGAEQLVVDLVYGIRETELIAAARATGARTVDGLEILVRQGAESLRGWTGMEPPIDAMRRAVRGEG